MHTTSSVAWPTAMQMPQWKMRVRFILFEQNENSYCTTFYADTRKRKMHARDNYLFGRFECVICWVHRSHAPWVRGFAGQSQCFLCPWKKKKNTELLLQIASAFPLPKPSFSDSTSPVWRRKVFCRLVHVFSEQISVECRHCVPACLFHQNKASTIMNFFVHPANFVAAGFHYSQAQPRVARRLAWLEHFVLPSPQCIMQLLTL